LGNLTDRYLNEPLYQSSIISKALIWEKIVWKYIYSKNRHQDILTDWLTAVKWLWLLHISSRIQSRVCKVWQKLTSQHNSGDWQNIL
jgi:hypothetical protein